MSFKPSQLFIIKELFELQLFFYHFLEGYSNILRKSYAYLDSFVRRILIKY